MIGRNAQQTELIMFTVNNNKRKIKVKNNTKETVYARQK